jgi:hypothetical protein
MGQSVLVNTFNETLYTRLMTLFSIFIQLRIPGCLRTSALVSIYLKLVCRE